MRRRRKDAQPVEKEQVQVSNDLVKDRQKWLDEAAKKDAQPVEKEAGACEQRSCEGSTKMAR